MKTKDRIYGRMVKKIVAGVLMITLTVSIPIAQKQESMVKAETVSRRVEWNIKCLNAEKSYEESKNLKKIKVAILDSGLDYDEDLPAVEKKDFLGQEELHPLYQDMTGHGTSVASLICARENEDRITGIAANVELYIGRIFGYGNDAPVDRVVKAVNWAIDRKVNIIHMSFGTQEYSGELEDAIEKAYKSGILIIAAAGNVGQAPEDESTIEYPAAFDNVISVGATNKYNNMSDFSSTGTELDVVAPGDQILTDGAFGGVSVDNGTSISAAQVTGVAAVLWGKHPDKSNEFIKSLLVGSANKEAVNSEDCGEGLVDYKEADKNYEEMNKAYQEYKKEGISEKKAVEKAEGEIPENVKSVKEHGEVNYVNASWSRKNHKAVVENGNQNVVSTYIDAANIDYVKMGVVHSDTYEQSKGMSANPYFHGRGNYFANTHYLYCMAMNYINGNETLPTDKQLGIKKIKKKVKKKVKKTKKSKKAKKKQYTYVEIDPVKQVKAKMANKDYLKNYFKSFQDKSLYDMNLYSDDIRLKIETDTVVQGYVLLGAAIHNVTDIFSHNIYKKTAKEYGGVWCPTVHEKKGTALKWSKLASKDNKDTGANEKNYLNYLINNFAISDKRVSEENSINLEVMYQLANEAGICVLASSRGEQTWYNLLKTKLKQAKTGGLKLRDINNQWKILTEKKANFSNLSKGKNNKEKKVKVSYAIRQSEKRGRYISIQIKNVYGCSVYFGNKLVNDISNVNPIKLKGKKVKIRTYRGFESKVSKVAVKFKIKYSCKGMENVKLKKGKKNKIQVANMGKDITFVPEGEIFKKTKGKNRFKGWHIKRKGESNKNRIDFKFDKKKKKAKQYPENMGNVITLYPVFG